MGSIVKTTPGAADKLQEMQVHDEVVWYLSPGQTPVGPRNYISGRWPNVYPVPASGLPIADPKKCEECKGLGTVDGCKKCRRTSAQPYKREEPKKKVYMPCACEIDHRDCDIHRDIGPKKGWVPPND